MTGLGHWILSVLMEVMWSLISHSLSGEWSRALDIISDCRGYVAVDE